MSDTYKAIVGKVHLVPIQGAKTLQLAYYNGLQFAVDKSLVEDRLYLIFGPDGQLSKEYAEHNDLIRRKDENGNAAGGFFELNRKVRSIKLMKGTVISVGFIADLTTLPNYKDDLKEGDEISEYRGVPICNKYINEATRKASGGQNKTKIKRDYEKMIGFAEHQDTSQFYKSFKSLVEPGDIITVTLKLDGTSVRIGNPYLTKHNTWYNRLLSKLLNVNMVFNRFTVGTRRVTLSSLDKKYEKNKEGYYKDNHSMYREPAAKLEGLLLPGETIYGEIVGWVDENRVLFDRGGVKFKYGCAPGTRDFYVYNIKHTLPNGYTFNLPWNLIKARCMELGVKYVPEIPLECGQSQAIVDAFIDDDHRNNYLGFIHKAIEELIVGADPIDPSHIREGVVVRIDKANVNQTHFLKAKSMEYYQLEDQSKMSQTFVDIEEVESMQETV